VKGNKHCYITCKTTRKYNIPLQNTNKEIPHSFTIVNYIPGEPTYSLRSWGAQEHLYSSDILLSMQNRSKPFLLFSLPFPITRHYFWRIHDVRLRLPRVMLDTITLLGNLIVGFGVLSAPKSMLKNRLHLVLESSWAISIGGGGGCTRPLSLYGSRSDTS
jgi:hypothetical protein